MAKQGYIKLYRQLQDCWIWNDKEYEVTKGHAWIDILLSCNHEDKKVMFDGKPYIVKRGEWITSILSLSDKWGWGRKKVSNFLNILEEDGMIVQDRNNKRTLIKVVNYDTYQGYDNDDGTTKEQQTNTKGTSEEHQRNTNNNDNNDNNDNNYINNNNNNNNCSNSKNDYSDTFLEFWKLYPRKEGKGDAYKKYNARLNNGFSPEEILTATRNYIAEIEKRHTEPQYIKHPKTFLADTLPFTDYLNKQEVENGRVETADFSEGIDKEQLAELKAKGFSDEDIRAIL